MFIKKHGHNTLYCTKHNDKEIICAVETFDRFTKWYYPNGTMLEGTPLNFNTIAAYGELSAMDARGDTVWADVIFNYDNSLPTVAYSAESMLDWIDKNAEQIYSTITLFDEVSANIPRILIDMSQIPANLVRHLLDESPSKYAIPPACQPKETQIDAARAHIENKEYLVPVYRLDSAEVRDAYHKVLERIEKLKEEGYFNVRD